MQSSLTSKGQITIPKKIRDYLHIERSDVIDFKIDEDGKVYIDTPEKSISSFSGMLSKYKKEHPLTIEQMDDIIASEILKKVP